MIKKIILKTFQKLGYKLVKEKSDSKKMREAFRNLSWSQEGEDLILTRYFSQRGGCFIDVGAHHPYRYSNTYRLYRKGWRGVNIDPLPGMKLLFDSERPEDINIECAISTQEGKAHYYMFNLPQLNTFSKQNADLQKEKWPLKEIKSLNVYRLDQILKEIDFAKKIDLLSIDVEGLEMEVLKSNDWDKYIPKVIVVENLNSEDNSVDKYLNGLGYKRFANTINSYFYELV